MGFDFLILGLTMICAFMPYGYIFACTIRLQGFREARIEEQFIACFCSYVGWNERNATPNLHLFFSAHSKNPNRFLDWGFLNTCLAMTYSHMGNPHTTIGDASFHFRVRYGIGWFQRSMVTRQNWLMLRLLNVPSGIQNYL